MTGDGWNTRDDFVVDVNGLQSALLLTLIKNDQHSMFCFF
jgi:hypothetical protein